MTDFPPCWSCGEPRVMFVGTDHGRVQCCECGASTEELPRHEAVRVWQSYEPLVVRRRMPRFVV